MKNYLHKSTFKGIKGELTVKYGVSSPMKSGSMPIPNIINLKQMSLMLIKQADHMCFRQFQYIRQEESKIGDDVIKLTGLN